MKRFPYVGLIGLLAIALLLLGDGLPAWSWPVATKPDAVVYTFEKDLHGIPSPVMAALDRLNRQGILATTDEIDTTDGTGDVPDQYKLSRPAAVAAGMPALVVLGGGRVIRAVSKPTTLEQVMEAAQ